MVLGQAGFESRDENAGEVPSAMSMRWPHAAAVWSGKLLVADAGNNRLLVWNSLPQQAGQSADFILGQSSVEGVDHNQSFYWPRRNSLNMPYGICASERVGVLVADTANSRILGWNAQDLASNEGASALFGQPDFNAKGDNRWQPAVADSLCWPYSIQAFESIIVIVDSGNNRISIWNYANE
jgi:hypothetical protein